MYLLICILLLLLQFADVYTTNKAIESKKGVEANPIARFILDKTGYLGLLIIKLVVFGFICFYTSNVYILGLIVLFYVYIVNNNWKIYNK